MVYDDHIASRFVNNYIYLALFLYYTRTNILGSSAHRGYEGGFGLDGELRAHDIELIMQYLALSAGVTNEL